MITKFESSHIANNRQKESLINNRFINLQVGKNHNITLDEYVKLQNRESKVKVMCSGYQTKESILSHSKEYPHVINYVKHYDDFCHVKKVAVELFFLEIFYIDW